MTTKYRQEIEGIGVILRKLIVKAQEETQENVENKTMIPEATDAIQALIDEAVINELESLIKEKRVIGINNVEDRILTLKQKKEGL